MSVTASFHAAYAPPVTVFHANGFTIINEHWGAQLPPLVYGPLWLALDRIEVAHASSYAQAFLIVRIAALCWLTGIVGALRVLRVPFGVLAVVGVNPALYYWYVVEVHNDLLGIFLIVAGMGIAVRRPLAGAVVGGAAGLVKISFLLVALLVAATRQSLMCRALQVALIATVVTIGSAAFGGADYIHAMTGRADLQMVSSRHDAAHAFGRTVHLCMGAIALFATFFALMRVRFVRDAAYSYAGISAIWYPWYLGWGVPYAIRAPGTAAFFIAFPAVSRIIDPNFPLFPARSFAPFELFAVIVTVASVWAFWRELQPRLRPQKKAALG